MLILLLSLVNSTKNSTFTRLPKYAQNVLIHAIGEVLIQTIKSEIENAPFIAIMLDESTDIACKSQPSIDEKMVKYERFTDVNAISTEKDFQWHF